VECVQNWKSRRIRRVIEAAASRRDLDRMTYRARCIHHSVLEVAKQPGPARFSLEGVIVPDMTVESSRSCNRLKKKARIQTRATTANGLIDPFHYRVARDLSSPHFLASYRFSEHPIKLSFGITKPIRRSHAVDTQLITDISVFYLRKSNH
jgi:hypothetical protein